MQAILIDVARRTITEVEYDGQLETIYKLVGCEMVEAPTVEKNGDSVFVDEEGLFKPQPYWFLYDGYPQPLAGNGLLLGLNRRNGESISPKTPLETVKSKVRFMSYNEVKAYAREHGL